MTYTPKTTRTNQPVDEYVSTVSERRQQEARALVEIMERATGELAAMWGPSMIGFGSYHYVSKSGSEADGFKVCFSPRQAKISLYLTCDVDSFDEQLAQLGKHTRGAGCVYVNKLTDIDVSVLERLVAFVYDHTRDYDARQERL